MSKQKKCYSGIGGQAVLEGIMMKNNTRYSVAVRKPDGEIDVEIGEYTGILGGSGLTKMPFVRGVFAFADSLILGTRCLNHSAAFYEEEDAGQESAADQMLNKVFKDKAESILMVLTTVIAVILAVGIFMVLPYFISDFLNRFVRNESLLAIMEGVIRILIFVSYVLLISLMKDIRRVYMYHGAEHKCINCIEHGRELNVENVMKSSKQHRRCGTSFLLFVMIVSVVLFFFIRVDNLVWKVVIRILLIPVIAGIAYEIIRLAGRYDNWLVRTVSAPGLWLQGLTTKEPTEDMVEVAIKAVEAVFDWKAYLAENFGYEEEPEEDTFFDGEEEPEENTFFDDEEEPEEDTFFDGEEEPEEDMFFDGEEELEEDTLFDGEEEPEEDTFFDGEEEPEEDTFFDGEEEPEEDTFFDGEEELEEDTFFDGEEEPEEDTFFDGEEKPETMDVEDEDEDMPSFIGYDDFGK